MLHPPLTGYRQDILIAEKVDKDSNKDSNKDSLCKTDQRASTESVWQ